MDSRTPQPSPRRLGIPRLAWATTLVAFTTVGCAMPNGSNPTLEVTSASVAAESADIDVVIANPSEHDLRLESIEYTLVLGPLPVSNGRWDGHVVLAAGQRSDLALTIPFDAPPLDPTARDVEFSGEMSLEDVSASGDMGLQRAAFRSVASTGDVP